MTALDERAPMSTRTARSPAVGAALSIELRHLRYFVALADAGSFTHAAQRIFIAQPTLSQQIRRLEEIVGTPLLQRRREGLRLTAAGHVLLDASRNVLALVDHEVSRTRQAAGWGASGYGWRYHPTCLSPWQSRPPPGYGRQLWRPGWTWSG
jgi:Transcriptional regulator